MPKIPLLKLPTSDYEEMSRMNNRRLLALLRSAVLAPERLARFSPRPPADHDAYHVRHSAEMITVRLYRAGEEVFQLVFMRADDSY